MGVDAIRERFESQGKSFGGSVKKGKGVSKKALRAMIKTICLEKEELSSTITEGKCEDKETATDGGSGDKGASYLYTAPVFAAIRQDIELAAEQKAMQARQEEELLRGTQDNNLG